MGRTFKATGLYFFFVTRWLYQCVASDVAFGLITVALIESVGCSDNLGVVKYQEDMCWMREGGDEFDVSTILGCLHVQGKEQTEKGSLGIGSE